MQARLLRTAPRLSLWFRAFCFRSAEIAHAQQRAHISRMNIMPPADMILESPPPQYYSLGVERFLVSRPRIFRLVRFRKFEVRFHF